MALCELEAVSAKLMTYFCPAGDCTKSAKSFAEANLSSTCCCMAFCCLRRRLVPTMYRTVPKNAHIVSMKLQSFRSLCDIGFMARSEERRVGKECRSRGWPNH